nr:MAG TPA: hypothetical protein [Caudoviricetes sp.]
MYEIEDVIVSTEKQGYGILLTFSMYGRTLGTEMISTTQAKLLRDSLTKILEDDGTERDDQEETGEQF